jgi:hypothetical protein
MGERDWHQRYRSARDYADEQAEKLRLGEEINGWAFKADWKQGEPEPPKILLRNEAWVMHAYEIAADAAMSLMHAEGKQWQATVDECKRKAEEWKTQALKDLIANALHNDSAWHKQWYLWRIAEVLGLNLDDQWDEDYPEPEQGIAP